MKQSRVNLSKTGPELYKAVLKLEEQMQALAEEAGITKGMRHLLKLRASQLNSCAHCVRMHARDALKAGESADRVALVAAWRESGYFSDEERAMLGLVEAVTHIGRLHEYEEAYRQAEEFLNEKELAAVQWLALVINAWNRVAVPSGYPVKPE